MDHNLKCCPCCGKKTESYVHRENGVPSGDAGFVATAKCSNRNCGLQMQKWAAKRIWAVKSLEKAWNRRNNNE